MPSSASSQCVENENRRPSLKLRCVAYASLALTSMSCLALVGSLRFTTSKTSRRMPIAAHLGDLRKATNVLLQAATTATTSGSPRDEGGDVFRSAMLTQQLERQRRLRAACQRGLSSAPKLPPSVAGGVQTIVAPPTAKYYFTVPKLGVSYCGIPKCASTTLKGFFERISGLQCTGLPEHRCADAHLNGTVHLGDAQTPVFPYMLLAIRSPWARLVSAYVDKYVIDRHVLTQSCYERHGANRHGAKPLNFRQFVQCVIGDYEAGVPLDQHIAPMHWMCDQCTVNYSYIATVETLGDDFLYLSRYVFPPSINVNTYDKVFAAGYRRPNEINNKTRETYARSYASLSTRELNAIIRLYKPDALYHGYPERPI